VVLPRVRDFRGVSTKSFDGRGNYTLGLHDQLIFPEIDYARVDKLKGMNVTIVTTAGTMTKPGRFEASGNAVSAVERLCGDGLCPVGRVRDPAPYRQCVEELS